MTAFLSDGSAPAITDTSQVNNVSETGNFYAISYSAASAGQTLTVRRTIQGTGCLYIMAATLTGAPRPESPVVTSISPRSGIAGTMVTIVGNGFGSSQGSGTVSLGGMPATIVAWSGGQIQAAVPPDIQTGPVQVTTGVGASKCIAM
jgi:hypothetical protein